MHKINPRKRPK